MDASQADPANTTTAALVLALINFFPDLGTLFWGAVGGYVGMSRASTGNSFRAAITILVSAALIAGALTSIISSVTLMYLPNLARKTIDTAAAFTLGWGFFKVSDPLLAMLLDALRSILARVSGAVQLPQAAPPVAPGAPSDPSPAEKPK